MIKAKKTTNNSPIHTLFLTTFIITLILLITQSWCLATTVVLQWDPVTDSSLSGYKLYYQADSTTQPFHGTGATQGASPVLINKQTTSTTISGLDPNHAYYFAITAYNATSESAYSNIITLPPLASNLSLTITGNGSGSVNSSPSILTCTAGTCSAQANNGSTVTLFATPGDTSSALSLFSGWSGCSSTNGTNCTINVTTSTNITATFSALQPVHIDGGNYYSTLQSAYNSANNSNDILTQAVTLPGGLATSANTTISLKGGYNADYSSRSGNSVMQGALVLGKGTLIADCLEIR